MNKEHLKQLEIENLRGSIGKLALSFDKNKKLCVIYGENGSGKSTICDAFDFIGKENVGSLRTRGLGKTTKFWPSLGKTPTDVRVSIETSLQVYSASLRGGKVIIAPSGSQLKIEVLRRSQILSLIEAKPGERYEAIKRFIDVSGIEESEKSLRSLIRDIEGEIKVSVARLGENNASIESFWQQAGKPGTSALAWASEEAERNMSTFDAKRKAVESLKLAIMKLREYPARHDEYLNSVRSAETAVQEARVQLETLKTDASNEYLELVELLHAAQRHFTKHPSPSVCPLCESSENAHNLVSSVNHRIASLQLSNQLKQAENTLKSAESNLGSQKNSLIKLGLEAKQQAERYASACKNEHIPAGLQLPALPAPTQLADWRGWLAGSDPILSDLTRIYDDCADNTKFINALKDTLQSLKSNKQTHKDLEKVLPHLKNSLEIMEDERRKFTDQLLRNIASEVGRLYEAVHPGEGLNNISLVLDPDKRASLELFTNFLGHCDAPPQAYFSDSHLDTLGLCVFIALAKMEAPEETILVLDDVLGSVDEPHVDRLIEMLYEEALTFRHCIITTHYKPWKHKLRWGWLKNGQCQFVELNNWTRNDGISLIQSIPDIERLKHLLSETPPDPQLVCAKAGVILEASLDFLTQLYECHVPRRASNLYTLGDLLPAVDKKLRASLRVEHKKEYPDGTISYVERQLAPHLDELTKIAQARNVFGCHFNALSFTLLDSDAIRFGNEVLSLIEALIDLEHGWPKNSKSGSYWATPGETRRLHPLKKPG